MLTQTELIALCHRFLPPVRTEPKDCYITVNDVRSARRGRSVWRSTGAAKLSIRSSIQHHIYLALLEKRGFTYSTVDAQTKILISQECEQTLQYLYDSGIIKILPLRQ